MSKRGKTGSLKEKEEVKMIKMDEPSFAHSVLSHIYRSLP
jgi:hypothetical protein